MNRLVTFTLLLAISFPLVAETVYIRDIVYVPLRGGQSQEHRILHQGLRSGLKLERLESNELTGYSKVRTEGGLEGWLPSQYLVKKPIAAERIEEVTAELEELETLHQQTLTQLREAVDAKENVIAELTSIKAAKKDLMVEVNEISALAEKGVIVDQKNSIYNEERRKLNDRVNALALANQALRENNSQKWFLSGAAAILLGLMFGLWIGRRVYEQHNSGGWG